MTTRAKQKQAAEEASDRIARRKLLQLGVYTAPAIVGTLMVPRDAQAQATPSCDPAVCNPAPCTPSPCDPSACGPYPCDPAPCHPAPCDPGACEPNPCGPVPCQPKTCGPHR